MGKKKTQLEVLLEISKKLDELIEINKWIMVHTRQIPIITDKGEVVGHQ